MSKVLFDPGYKDCILSVSDNIEFMYSVFESSYMPIKQKKFQFTMLAPKIKGLLKKNICFYLGCLLWATYIKKERNAEIENNPCLGDEYNKEDVLSEVCYLKNFIKDKFPKDFKFYTGKTLELDKKFLKILENYEKFVDINLGFISLKNTEELLLTDEIKNIKNEDYEKIKHIIENAIKEKDLTKLYKGYDLIFD